MAEQINIGSFDFDTDSLVKNLLESRKEIDNLKSAMTESRKVIRDSVKDIRELEKAQDALQKSGKENSDEYKENAKELDKLNVRQEEHTKLVLNSEFQLKRLNKEQRAMNDILHAQSKTQIENSAVMEKANELLEKQWHSKREAWDIGKSLMTLQKQLNPEIEEEAEMMAKLAERTNEANEYQKDFRTDNQKRIDGIGEYKKAIMDSIKAMTGFKGAVTSAGGASKGSIPGVNGLTASVQSFTAIPLVAIISLIVKGLQQLWGAFSETQDGMDKINSVLRPLTVVWQTFMSLVGDLAGLLANQFTKALKDPLGAVKSLGDSIKNNLTNRIKAFGVIWNAIKTGDFKELTNGVIQLGYGIEDATGKMSKYASKIGEAWDKGKQLDRTIKDIEQRENNLVALRAENDLQIERITEKLRDSTLTYKERAEFAKERLKLEEQTEKQQQIILKMKLSQLMIEQDINGETRERNREIQETIALINKSEQDVQKLRNRNRRFIAGAKKEQADANKRAQEAEIERQKKIIAYELEQQQIALKTFQLLNEKNAETAQDEIDFAEDVANQKKAILDKQLEGQLISQIEYDFQVKKLEIETAEEISEITLFYATERVNKEILLLQEQQSERIRLTKESFEEENDLINTIAEQREANVKERYKAGLIDRHEYNDMLLEIEQEQNDALTELRKEWKDQNDADEEMARMLENEAILLNIQNRWELEKTELQQQFDEKQRMLDKQYADGELSEENYLKAIENLNEENARALNKIDQLRNENKIGLASDTLGSMATIMGEETDAGKFFASAQATIDTYSSAVSAFNSMSGIPIIGPALGAVAAAGAIAMGLKNIKEINKTKTDFYTGGYTGDGGVFDRRGAFHGGEVVFSQQDVQLAGGVNRVESMRPTSEIFGQMPDGVQKPQKDNWIEIAEIIGQKAKEGTQEGTNTGIVQAESDRDVKRKAIF